MIKPPNIFLPHLFNVAIKAVSPEICLEKHIPIPPNGKTFLIGAGKASAAMAKTFENFWSEPLEGIIVVPYGHKVECNQVEIIEAAHPIPDQSGELAAQKILSAVKNLGKQDLVVALISGGGSALLPAPPPSLTLQDKQEIIDILLNSGATIQEINLVRRSLSIIKGGKLAQAAHPARISTLIISDISNDDPSMVASGPTIKPSPDHPKVETILKKYKIEASARVKQFFKTNGSGPNFDKTEFEKDTIKIIAKNSDCLNAAVKEARKVGWQAGILEHSVEGQSHIVASKHAERILNIAKFRNSSSPPLVLFSGGETTVNLGNFSGNGGPNSEYLLALGLSLNSDPRIWAIACDTDGIDGNSDAAGAILTPYSLLGAEEIGLDPTGLLAAHRSSSFFEALDHNIFTGPTLTNVNDFRAIAIFTGNNPTINL